MENTLIEAKANRFAAEFLFPEAALKSIILDEFKTSKLEKVSEKTILRFIVRTQCTWWLPYRSIVKRLHEISAISEGQYRNYTVLMKGIYIQNTVSWERLLMTKFSKN